MRVFCMLGRFPCLWAVSCNICLFDTSIYSCDIMTNEQAEYFVTLVKKEEGLIYKGPELHNFRWC